MERPEMIGTQNATVVVWLEARVEQLETAIRKVLADEESQEQADGTWGWGPDVTMVAVLKEALDG